MANSLVTVQMDQEQHEAYQEWLEDDPWRGEHQTAEGMRRAAEEQLRRDAEFTDIWDPFSPAYWEAERISLYLVLMPLLERIALAGVDVGTGKLLELGLAVDYGLSNEELIQWIRINGAELSEFLTINTRRRVAKAVANWSEAGETFPELIKRIEPIVGDSRAEAVAVTETTRYYAEGQVAIWRDQGFVEAKEWLTSEDTLVCEICRPLNEVAVGLDEAWQSPAGLVQNPPAHVRCRCDVGPVVRAIEEWSVIQELQGGQPVSS